MDSLGVTTLYIADSEYFRIVCKLSKISGQIGYILNVALDGFSHMKAILTYNYQSLYHQPKFQEQIDLSITTLANSINGIEIELGANIIKYESYPYSADDIKKYLGDLHKYPTLTCDIEAFSLKFNEASIGSIGFAWNQHEGMSFLVDELDDNFHREDVVRRELKKFFETYTGTLIYHGSSFDIKILIYELWMENTLDSKGLVNGLEIMTKNIHDTKVIAYLATNTTAGNSLGLKYLAHEFAGNYAEKDINDITQIAESDLLRYNLMDCLSTWYVFNKYHPIMLQDNQEGVYKDIMIPSLKTIIHMELTGLALDSWKVHQTNDELQIIRDNASMNIAQSAIIIAFEEQLRKEECLIKNALLKVKVKPLSDFDSVVYNPNSNKQTGKLLYEWMGLPVLDKTDGGNPAVGAKTIAKLINHTTNPEHLTILNALIEIAEVSIILNTFVSAFINKSIIKGDGCSYLHGNFNLNGTKCMTADTLINTKRGLIRLSHIKIGDYVLTHKGNFKAVTDKFGVGLQKAHRLFTADGRVLTTTGNHPYLINGNWIDADKLQVGMEVTTHGEIEQWKLIRNFSGYEISTMGRVRNIKTNRIMVADSHGKYGHLKVTMSAVKGSTRADGTKKDKLVHRLVLDAFVGPCPDGYEVAHINDIPWDNSLSNLKYKTSKENSQDSIKYGTTYKGDTVQAKLNWDKVFFIREQAYKLNLNNVDIANLLNVSRELVRDVRLNTRWIVKDTVDKEIEFNTDIITKIQALGTRREMYSLTIEDDESHCTNGILTHNSGRISSSKVNLQNLPSTGSKYAKVIKSCFIAPPGWIMCGSDYDGIESVTQALITKDPEMLKVFTDGFDAHSLRAASFFPEDLPDDIDKNNPKSINSIKKNFPEVRQAAKSPYFLLQYQGTYLGLMEQFGFSKEKSIAIEKSYHDLYKVSDDWVKAHIDKASSIGYVTLAFGLRLRTPILKQTILGNRSTPYEAQAEARSAGNALTQSYGLLNSRSTNEFMDRVYKSKYRNDIKPMAMIHDSVYLLVKDSVGALKWVNDNLIDCMKWSGLPELLHPTVGMSGELSVFHPSWADEVTLPNNISMQEILNICGE